MAGYDGYQTATSMVWIKWNSTATTSCTSSADTWNTWNSTCSGTTATSTATTWGFWNNAGAAEVIYVPYVAPPETEEQKTARREAARKHAEAQAKREAERKAAEEKSEKLLEQHLNDEQRKDYRKKKAFYVTTGRGTKYLVQRGSHGNIRELDQAGREVRSLCINVSDGNCPIPDNVLAQKLLLEANEDEFRRIANIRQLVAA